MKLALLTLCAALTLPGCGLQGDLYLPDDPAPPVEQTPAPEQTPAATTEEVSEEARKKK